MISCTDASQAWKTSSFPTKTQGKNSDLSQPPGTFGNDSAKTCLTTSKTLLFMTNNLKGRLYCANLAQKKNGLFVKKKAGMQSCLSCCNALLGMPLTVVLRKRI
jgi:hypothetical protein